MLKLLSAKLMLLTGLLLSASVSLLAQTGEVTGKIFDVLDGTTLPGATVVIKGTTTGTSTDIDGTYKLNVQPNTTLVFSYVGYMSQEIVVEPGSTVNVAMKSESMGLDEVQIIGYGTQKKDDATGAVTSISAKDFNQGQITSATNLISGKVAGVQVVSGGGAPGEGSTIRIRGGASLNALNDPLIVIDGVAMNSDGISGARNPLNTINPNDIESFNILKDASATAIYGSRASNGVIIITTKKGKIGQPLQFTYDGKFSLFTPTKTVDVLDAGQFRAELNRGVEEGRISASALSLLDDKNISTNWQNEIFKPAFGQDHYLSAKGATKNMPYRVSLGYTNQDGILLNDNFSRFTAGFSLDPRFLDDHLTVSLNGQFGYINNKFADRGAIGGALQFDPTKPITNDSVYTIPIPDQEGQFDTTDYGGYYAWLQDGGTPVSLATTNPVALLNMREDKSDVTTFVGNVKLDYKVHFLPELRLTLNLGTDRSWSDGTVYVPYFAAWEYDVKNGGGVNNVYDQQRKNDLLDFYVTYDKSVESIKSHFVVMGGYSWQHFKRTQYSDNRNIPHRPSDTLIQRIFDDRTEYYLVSFYGRFNYTYGNRYMLTATVRQDGTSRFSPDNRWGLFPSVALGWKINEEKWLRDSKVISQLKLRLGWGITGQQALQEGNDYPYLPRYTASQPTANYQFGYDENGNPKYYQTLRAEGYDGNIKWEETETWNIALDYGFADDRFYGSIDFYKRKTKDLINFTPVPAGSNLTNYLLTNIGTMENKGVEFSIMTRPVVTENWYWDIGLNATYNDNKITKLTASDDPDYLGDPTGNISGGVGNKIQIQSVGHPINSFFVFEQVYGTDGKPIEGLYVDRNGDGEITDADRYHFQDPTAKFSFGINSKLRYKNWDFSFSGRANFGNYVYNNVASENGVYERLYRAEGPYLSNITSNVYETNFQSPRYLSDYYVQEASFFRMDYLSLSYLFANINGGRVSLRISGTVNNAFTITNYAGLDPEIFNGIDNNIYPRPRAYVVGVNLVF
ncbi:MAG: TonB-dependent receptor [Bacteroidales bacterium]|nr:TonB-dependent receptor [Bacteroidales bacterium]